jgi:hypothetical protein
MALKPCGFYLFDARSPVGFENHRKKFGHYIIEFFAILRITEFFALRARGDGFFHAACPYFAPAGLYVFMTAGASFFKVRAAGAAIQTAICHQIDIRNNISHVPLLLIGKKYSTYYSWSQSPTNGLLSIRNFFTEFQISKSLLKLSSGFNNNSANPSISKNSFSVSLSNLLHI